MGHKIVGASEQNGMRIKRFWNHETSDVGEAVVKWLKQHKSASLVVLEWSTSHDYFSSY